MGVMSTGRVHGRIHRRQFTLPVNSGRLEGPGSWVVCRVAREQSTVWTGRVQKVSMSCNAFCPHAARARGRQVTFRTREYVNTASEPAPVDRCVQNDTAVSTSVAALEHG